MRSTVEGTFDAIKDLFGRSIRATEYEGQVNEALLRVLCYNLTVLVKAMETLGLDPVFWKNPPKAPPTIKVAS